jgi:predicted component of viral defense system (DUF524 family)
VGIECFVGEELQQRHEKTPKPIKALAINFTQNAPNCLASLSPALFKIPFDKKSGTKHQHRYQRS